MLICSESVSSSQLSQEIALWDCPPLCEHITNIHLKVQPTVASVAMSGGLTRDELQKYVESSVVISCLAVQSIIICIFITGSS